MDIQVTRRNGTMTAFDAQKISLAMTKAFLAVENNNPTENPQIATKVDRLTQEVVANLQKKQANGLNILHIEDIQDQVELALMRNGEHKVARAYVLYREERAQARAAQAKPNPRTGFHMTQIDGTRVALDEHRLAQVIAEACQNLSDVRPKPILEDTFRNIYDGIAESELEQATMLSARSLIEREPNYTYVTARLLLDVLRHEALRFLAMNPNRPTHAEMREQYASYFIEYIARGIELKLLDAQLLNFDLKKLGAALLPDRDLNFTFLGLQTLYDRYFIHWNKQRFELPQAFFMRVAMGLAMNEARDMRNEKAIEFYQLLSSFDFMSSTPTLFNSATPRPQLSSCYLSTVPDDLHGIFEAIQDNAMLSKFAGGLGNDWTPVRGMGARIEGTNGQSQGVVPFLKVANDTCVAVNQCFAPDTRVFTAEGVRKIRDVQVNDLVLGISGQYRTVTKKMTYNQDKKSPMLALNIRHSVREIEVTDGHPFYALQDIPVGQSIARTKQQIKQKTKKFEWVDAKNLKVGDYIAQVIPTEITPVLDFNFGSNHDQFNEQDARFYGILLGDGHFNQDQTEWGISGNPQRDSHLNFVRDYLNNKNIHFWETQRGESYTQIRWASGCGAVRCGTTGRIIGAGAPTIGFEYADLYDNNHQKIINKKFSHLPKNQTLALLQGLLETDGCVSRGGEITFTSTSESLAEGVRYQCLRLGIATSGQYRERVQNHTGTRQDGSEIHFNGTVKAYDIRIPATPDMAKITGILPVQKQHYLNEGGYIWSRIKSIKSIETQPFVIDLLVDNDESYMTTAGLAHNGGKRKGAMCAYLETWHRDIEEFLDLRKNTGDERRRCHDMNTANWVPDLFMQRVIENQQWTLFSPDETPDLHELYGEAFAQKYVEYERMAAQGLLRNTRQLPAVNLWRKMLGMLFETGHPWITFKDPCNVRSPQQHVGVVHSSNLCTEITLNTKANEEIAVCNLGSINLVQHLMQNPENKNQKVLDKNKLRKTVHTAMRMLDNVIDYNYYSVQTARDSNIKHRPVGMGLMGFQDCLYELNIPYESELAVQFADESMELISYYAIEASAELAQERGAYSSFEGSLWSQGILPLDSIELLAKSRGTYLQQDRKPSQNLQLDWESLRNKAKAGMRNSNCMAIAPTATISNIVGVSQSIEPTYQNLYVKSNLSGEFTVFNSYLVQELKRRNLWDANMAHNLKYYDGSVQYIESIPEDLKQLYKCTFEMDANWLIQAGSRRQKWLDQAQSLNLYMAQPSGKKLDELYRAAWLSGLKTTYYLRTLGATHAEKSTIQDNRLNAVQMESYNAGASLPKACAITDPECEACQ